MVLFLCTGAMCSNASIDNTLAPLTTTIPSGVFSAVESFTHSSKTKFKN